MPEAPSHLYRSKGIEDGHDPQVIARAASERSRLIDLGVIPVLSLGHLAHLSGASYGYLRAVVERQLDPYQPIKRPKRDGSTRPIWSPNPMLLEVQRWILHRLIDPHPQHPASHAYRKGSSIVTCAREHVGASWLLKLDLHDFFGSIDEATAFNIFHGFGYQRLVSLELARLCTRIMSSERRPPSPSYTAIPSYLSTELGYLPQGAPTSGALANLATAGLDRKLSQFANAKGLVYTRYSDDIALSGANRCSRSEMGNLLVHARRLIESERFQVHRRKTHLVTPGARKIILGLLLDDEGVRLLPEFKRRVQVHIRGVEKFGLAAHADHRGFRSMFSFVNHVDGSLAFAHGVEPQFAAKASSRWTAALTISGFLVGGEQWV